MIYESGASSGLINVRPDELPITAPVVEQEYDADNPPQGELGSSFDYNSPFGGWIDGDVYAPAEPSLSDYHHMLDTDGTAASIELMLSYPIISAPWSIEPAKGDTGEAEFIYDALTALPHQGGPFTTVEQMVQQMTAAFTNKRAYFEKVFKVNKDNKIVYHKLAYRPPDTCELALDARTAEPRGFRQMPLIYPGIGQSQANAVFGRQTPRPDSVAQPGNWVKIPQERAFVYVHGTWRDPLMGVSAMKTPYFCYLTKRKVRWLWYQFLDQTALPKAIVQNQDEVQARNDAKKVASLRGRAVLALGAETTVTPYESAGHGAQYFQDAINFLDGEMLNAGLMGFLQLTVRSASGRGSYALATTMEQIFNRSRTMIALDMARQITNEVIGPLIAYNFGVQAPVPRFKFGPLNNENDAAALAAFQQIMAAQNANVPVEFYDELITRVSTILNLDPGKVAKDLSVNGSPQSTNLQLLATQVDQAEQMLRNSKLAEAQATSAPPTGTPAKAATPTETDKGAGVTAEKGTPGQGSATHGTVGTRPFGENSQANPFRDKNKSYGK